MHWSRFFQMNDKFEKVEQIDCLMVYQLTCVI